MNAHDPGDPASWPVTGARSVAALWRNRIRMSPNAPAFARRVGADWQRITWFEADARVRRIAAGLIARGVPQGARVAILCHTRVEWIYVDFAILCAGAATSTIYPSSPADDAVYILHDADCWGVFVEDAEQFAKLRAGGARTEQVFVVDPAGLGDTDEGWVSLEALEREGAAHLDAEPGAVDARIDALGPDDLATLIYTSGTTGRPKGVVLPHDCWLYQAEAVRRSTETRDGDEQYLFLPLAHSFGKICELIAVELGVPTAVDGNIDGVLSGLQTVRPTVMAAVPRVFEKIFNRVVTEAKKAGGRKYAVFRWALATGDRKIRLDHAGERVPLGLRLQFRLADRLVFRRLRDALGGRIRTFVSGGAPLSPEIGRFFQAAGMSVCEGYGLTETAAGAVANRPGDLRFGTVGRAFPGCELRIADTGEVLLRGRNRMRGYWNRPEDTAAAIDADGWLHTGDIGAVDADGRLTITGRIKDLIITSGGKNIAPSDAEFAVKAESTLVGEIVTLGDRRPFCVALVWLDPDAAAAFGRELGLTDLSYPALAADDRVCGEVRAAVERVNASLPSYATIKRVHVVPDAPISQESGLLTPSMKVKRAVVAERFAAVIDGFYAGTVATV